jgi:hypothetical protein
MYSVGTNFDKSSLGELRTVVLISSTYVRLCEDKERALLKYPHEHLWICMFTVQYTASLAPIGYIVY